ncbi:MAG: prepilin peptidase [Clostridium sp.]|nr:prepilin peptidase [Acetatifactor muris]MCM1527798.1 prepilin peptidase [Bacteroides sp.]MCM1563893.1 prepilin peptidase [Clostridium sp.]
MIKEIVLLIYLTILALFDRRERKIPVILPVAGGIAAILYNVYRLSQSSGQREWFLLSFVLGLFPGVLLLAVARLTGKAGYGDGLTLLSVGMWTGYKDCFLLLCLSLLLMAVFAAGMLFMRKAGRNTKLPYLPFLAVVYAVKVLC